MIPDEKKPIPWGLPPLPSVKEEEDTSVCYASNQTNKDGYMILQALENPDSSDEPIGLGKRLAVILGSILLLATSALFVHCCLCESSCTDLNPGTLTAVNQLVQTGFDTNNTVAWDRLAEMTDLFGHRMTGSRSYDLSAQWVVNKANKMDENLTAYTEPVWVDIWDRGKESLDLLLPTRPGGKLSIPMLGLGNSVGTPKGGIRARVVPVHSLEELKKLGKKQIEGKVVLYNFHFQDYGQAGKFRHMGAQWAEKYGAKAVLVRSATPDSQYQSVHTGSSVRARIPAAAISPADANLIERLYRKASMGVPKHVYPMVRLKMDAQLRPSAKQSANIIIDLKGSEQPQEIVLLSGHFDSWDVGVGAMDDGAGAVLAWEALRLVGQMKRRPKRTVRVVMWNNEETQQRGARAYFKQHQKEIKNHVFAMESDIGVFEPWGMAVAASQPLRDRMARHGRLLEKLGGGNITATEMESPGEDIAVLCGEGVPCAGWLSTDPENGAQLGEEGWSTYYFRHHHAMSDRMEALDKGQLRRSSAALAAWAYLIADM